MTTSDHFPEILTLDLTVPAAIPQRKVNLNLKSNEGQVMFHHMTNNTTKLSKIFLTNTTFERQVLLWEEQVQSFFHESFPKIRHRKRKFREDEVGYLLEKRKRLKLGPKTKKK